MTYGRYVQVRSEQGGCTSGGRHFGNSCVEVQCDLNATGTCCFFTISRFLVQLCSTAVISSPKSTTETCNWQHLRAFLCGVSNLFHADLRTNFLEDTISLLFLAFLFMSDRLAHGFYYHSQYLSV